MPTLGEIVALAGRLARQEVVVDMFGGEWDAWTEAERRECLTFAVYEVQRRTLLYGPAKRRSLRLFMSHLTEGERAEVRRAGTLTVTGSAGGRYRVHPRCGQTERVARHGTREFATQAYCLHDVEDTLPHADVALAHLLLLRADEPAFLAQANAYVRGEDMWSAAYRRRLREARRRREEADGHEGGGTGAGGDAMPAVDLPHADGGGAG